MTKNIEKHSKDSFDRISEEKRKRILSIAVIEFANKGFDSANTNTIAQKAEISIGSLYQYFETKEDLFLTTLNYGISQLEENLEIVLKEDVDLFGKIEKILRIIQTHSRQNQDIVRLYHEMTSESHADIITKLTSKMEAVSAKCYIDLINQAKTEGILSPKASTSIYAFLLDNIFMMLQFSYATEYYKERMKVYLGKNIFKRDEEVVSGIMFFLKNAFKV